MGRSPHLEPLRRQRFRFVHKKNAQQEGGAYSGISIHAAHTGTTAHSYAVLGLVVYCSSDFHSVLSEDLCP